MNTNPVFLRYLALDAHKHYVVIGGVNAACELVLSPRRLEWAELEDWLRTHLQPTDKVVIEATTNTWTLYDQVARYAGAVVVAHPPHIKLIGAALVKTDKRDVQVLAKLLALDLIPEVWVPPQPVRELRELTAHRLRLTHARTQTTNRLHSMLQRHNLAAPTGDPFAAQHRARWEALDLSPTEKLHVRQDLATLDLLNTQLAEVEQELARLSTVAPWAEQVPFLIQLPGIGLITAMIILAAVGDITRFARAKNLVGYAGLGTYVHDSGKTHRHGGITKHGRADLRSALVEAAWVAVRTHPRWQAEFARLSKRMPANQAIVAIARKLLVVVWHVLHDHQPDRHAQADKVAAKFFVWSGRLGQTYRGCFTPRQFVRWQLMQLGLGDDLTHIRFGGDLRSLPTAEELAALIPTVT